MDYYDMVLSGVFTSMVAGVSLGALTSLPLNLAAGVGALASLGFIYHGMFRRGPVTIKTGD